jgi:NADP-dependent 3-hydroxy acid dehydrogenase YdfG
MGEVEDGSAGVIAISGAGTGIGQAVATKFGSLGWRVVVGGRRVSRLQETASIIEKAGGTCLPHQLDVSDAASVEEFFTAAEAELGPVTAVVNNAATARYGPLDDFAPEEIAVEIATKLIGSLFMARRAIQSMRSNSISGDILFVTSSSAVQPWPFHLPYAAANAGVEQAVRSLRLELEGTGIRVTTFRCGETRGTEFSARENGLERSLAAREMWFRRGLLRHTGLMTPDMVADAVFHAVTLPRAYRCEIAIEPLAPAGELPRTFEEYGAAMMRMMAES